MAGGADAEASRRPKRVRRELSAKEQAKAAALEEALVRITTAARARRHALGATLLQPALRCSQRADAATPRSLEARRRLPLALPTRERTMSWG